MTKKERNMVIEEWRRANDKIGSLECWKLEDIREGKHPDYQTDIEFMQDLGYYQGVQDLYQKLIG